MKGHIIEFKNSPTKKALESTTVERDNLRNEVASLKSQLAQKDTTISSLNSQVGEVNSWKSSYNSAQSQVQSLQSQVQGLNVALSQKDSELNSLKTQSNRQEREIAENHANDIVKYTKELSENKLEAKNLKEKLELKERTVEEKEKEIKRLTSDFAEKDSKINELLNSLENENKKNPEIQNKLIASEARLEFLTKFFDEVKQEKDELRQEKIELKNELKSYKKALVKKHDLSTSQSIEIEKLRHEVLEMSRSKIDDSLLEKGEDSRLDLERSYAENLKGLGTHTTMSQLLDTQEVGQYIKVKKGSVESMFSGFGFLEPFHLDTKTKHKEVGGVTLAGENFTVINEDNL